VKQYWQFQVEMVDWFYKTVQTRHGFIVFCGLSIGLFYLPVWLGYLIQRSLGGAAGWLLILVMLSLAFSDLWKKRHQLEKLTAPEADRLLGHLLIASAVFVFPFCRFAIWSQAILWLIILVGIAVSSWGVTFFRQFKLAALFFGLTVYPKLGIISRTVWEFFFPPNYLENSMAWVSASILETFGWSATSIGRSIVMPQGAVAVGWGCNGLDMAITMALAVLFMGLLFKLNTPQILSLMSVAAVLALTANIPRLILVTIAYVYWGEQWFKFWHGFLGGQIFSGIVFTILYYAVIAIVKQQPTKSLRD
jgi:exosortase/archaeosortase family protein